MWEAQFWFGRKLDKISPETDAGNLGSCALLIIQNRDDQVTPLADGQAILAAAGFNAQMWTVPSVGSRRRDLRGSCRIRRARNQIS